eukprot:5004065-Pyramimonas_sp.AAC.1
MLNDGMWHHVAVTVDADGVVMLVVDAAAINLGSLASYSALDLTGGFTVGKGPGPNTFYRGLMDQLAVFSAAKPPSWIMDHSFLVLAPNTPDLVSYLQHSNLAALTENNATVAVDYVDMEAVTVHGNPSMVTSSAPILRPLVTAEDAPVTVDLLSPEFAKAVTGERYRVIITKVPKAGTLMDPATGEHIDHAPFALADGGHHAVFVSGTHEHGDEDASPRYLYSSFNYIMRDTDLHVDSDEQMV